jgi:leucyl aminopeptidase
MAITIKVSNKAQLNKSAFVVVVAKNSTTLKAFSFYKEHADYIQQKQKEKENTILHLPTKGQHWVVVLQGKKEKEATNHLEGFRVLGGKLCSILNREKATDVEVINAGKGSTGEEFFALLEGLQLANYQFSKYKSDKKINSIRQIALVESGLSLKEVVELNVLMESVCIARDLINEPVIELSATALSKAITTYGKKAGYTTKVLKKAEIEKLKMGGLLGVNRGSIDPPTFTILEWKPAKAVNKKPIVLVGKGVVYDTGGNNLKTGGFMSTMKSDMSGSAAVVGTMNAVAGNKLPLYVIGLIPATDNRIGLNALVADDVITMHDGTTVEIQNTDAEGRLILADALSYAKQYQPELVIDLATLTGAASAITGPFGTAMVGTADASAKANLAECGDAVYERIAELPFWREYGDLLKSDIADLKNIGGPTGGAITAGKFLEHFTDYPWIHLDIAGPAFINKAETYKPVGGTGVGVRLLYRFLKERTTKK